MQATGITPHDDIERARADAARMLLKGSDRPLKAAAFDCGFGPVDRMRIAFTTRLGVTPVQYRASFRRAGSAFSVLGTTRACGGMTMSGSGSGW
ncbi:AraC family transcriptional regulator [Siccirubricoccus sp. KC 17139]|uniref:AraC family transcriptional regulator n=1 Tax=Siccirubricoccus soli TaxID=2899147 RepID=A0ABT1D655_9PROT|nr:AraC family transcriptional regulator [Siccirubricoccus soli]MCP2683543.1 AraC family transcriptional regulator [Siccirubricoccus soli]